MFEFLEKLKRKKSPGHPCRYCGEEMEKGVSGDYHCTCSDYVIGHGDEDSSLY